MRNPVSQLKKPDFLSLFPFGSDISLPRLGEYALPFYQYLQERNNFNVQTLAKEFSKFDQIKELALNMALEREANGYKPEEQMIDHKLEMALTTCGYQSKRIFDYLTNFEKNCVFVHPSYEKIAEDLIVCEETVKRGVNELREKNLLFTIHQGRFNTLLFFVHPYFSPQTYDLFNDVLRVDKRNNHHKEKASKLHIVIKTHLDNLLENAKRNYSKIIAYLKQGRSPCEDTKAAAPQKAGPSLEGINALLNEKERERYRCPSWETIEIDDGFDKVPSQSVLDEIFNSRSWKESYG
jgi:hypothetical protein